MVGLKRKLIAVTMGLVVALGVLAEPQKGDKRPKKDPPKVVVEQKGEKPPQNSNNQGDKDKGDKKGKP